MKDILNKLGIQDIGADRYYTECPRCAKSRKKINSKSLLVVKEGDSLIVKCFHHDSCEWNKTQIIRSKELHMLPKEVNKFIKFPKGFTLPGHIENQFSEVYKYCREDGEILYFKGRKEATEDSKKSFIHIGLLENGDLIFQKPIFTTLYKLEDLKKDTTILFVEGEKAANYAATVLQSDRVSVMSWDGGASRSAIDKLDLSKIEGRNIIIWPDNDEPGLDVGRYLADKLSIRNNVRIVDTKDLPAKSDIADFKDINFIKQKLIHSVEMIDIPLEGELSIEDMLSLHKDSADYYSTGFNNMDKYVRLPRNGFAVISGRTGHGKSVFMTNIAINLAKQNVNVVYLSYELPRAEMDIRFVKTLDGRAYSDSGWEEDKIIQGHIKNQSTEAVRDYIELLRTKRLRIVDAATEVVTLINLMNAYGKKNTPLVVICDYAQIIPLASSDKNRYVQLKEMVELFRKTANKNNQLFIAGSQLTAGETAYTDTVRESKDIEFTATLHLKVWRKLKARTEKEAKYYEEVEGQTIISVEKSRQVGADGRVFGFNSTNGHKLIPVEKDKNLNGEF